MCDECVGIQEQYRATAKRLLAAQRELACYEIGRRSDSFTRLWNDCQDALKHLWELREAMTTHATRHASDAVSSDA